jgi:hypothetical protein
MRVYLKVSQFQSRRRYLYFWLFLQRVLREMKADEYQCNSHIRNITALNAFYPSVR